MKKKLNIAIITGSRAEFGLLRPVIDAVRKHPRLKLQLIAAGSHFLAPARTIKEVAAAYPIAARVPMQKRGHATRSDDAAATAKGIAGFTRAFKKLEPDWVVVLGDRIEAFAAASAASIAGIAVAHIHGGDRAEGIADEAMRHAITKLAHLHCAATKLSAVRIMKMGESREHVYVTGSPAVDQLLRCRALSDREAKLLGDPAVVVLLHPAGLAPADEAAWATTAWATAASMAGAILNVSEKVALQRALFLSPNFDPGHGLISAVWNGAPRRFGGRFQKHLPRLRFLELLCRMRDRGGVLIGNSSAGLIEAAVIGVRTVNLGPRQHGRERAGLVVDMPTHDEASFDAVSRAIRRLRTGAWPVSSRKHPYGEGRAGPRIAALLAKTDPHDPALLRKRNAY